jgi:hypothetical protein
MGFKSQDDNAHSFDVKTTEQDFQLEQNVKGYKDYASKMRELDSNANSMRQYRPYAIIPDIVAVDMLTKYGLDIHAPDFMSNPASVRKLKQLIETEYSALKTSSVRANL